MPMSSPAPFYRYSSITTPGTAPERSSPPSSGAIDLAETLVEFSSPVKLREPFTRRISSPSDHDDSPSRPQRNGIKSSLGDLQGVDLLRGFEKISSWREGSSPVKDTRSGTPGREETSGFGKELRKTNGNGAVGCGVTEREDGDSQMTDLNMEGRGVGMR